MKLWDRAVDAVNAALSVSPLAVNGDPVDDLRAEARDKLLNLRQQAKDAHAVLVSLTGELNELRNEKQQIDSHIKRLTMGAGAGGFQIAPDHPTVTAEQAKAARIGDEMVRLNSLYDARSSRWQDLARLVSGLDAWVKGQGGRELVAHVAPVPKLQRGETPSDAVERCRRRLRELHADLARVEAAPIPSAQAKEAAQREVARLAAQGCPNVGALVEAGAKIEWPMSRADVAMWADGKPSPHVPLVRTVDPLALAAWLNPSAMTAALEREIDELADDAAALTDEARAAKRAEVLADLLAVERDEEAFIIMAAASGIEIMRRPDASPLAVLGLSGS
ncbi:hypothetical protein [Microvirga sp. KLBC 81]|uniref:hypothetical protein n=1 Tax=Microvirga sp. KLBC 81 TaxID=1862707 RepID=UPI001057D5EC|nr:hypothetical protein [Microvirga sp. KLBC 81]